MSTPKGIGKLAHLGALLAAAAITATALIHLLLPDDSLVGNILGWSAFGALLIGHAGKWRHSRGLCEHCIADWPLDSAAAAERATWPFAIHHRARWWTISQLALIMTVWVPVVGRFTMAAMLLGWAVEIIAERRHNLLYPWCPYCHDDGDDGDDDEPEPDDVPDPANKGTKVGVR
jgi:hypothetical protein